MKTETGVTPDTIEVPGALPAETDTIADTATVTDDGGNKDDIDTVYKTLEKERTERKRLERELKSKNRTEAERLADMEAELATLRIEKLRDRKLDDLLSKVPAGFTVDRIKVLEQLEDVALTESNVEQAIAKRVDALKRPVALKTPENVNPTPDTTGKKYGWDNLPSADEVF